MDGLNIATVAYFNTDTWLTHIVSNITADSTIKNWYRLRCYCSVLYVIIGQDGVITTNCGYLTHSDWYTWMWRFCSYAVCYGHKIEYTILYRWSGGARERLFQGMLTTYFQEL